MSRLPSIPRYNQPIPRMRARAFSGLRIGLPNLLLLAIVFLSSSLRASNLSDTARQLAHKIAAAAGPGAIALYVTNRSSLDEKSLREVRGALEAELSAQGVHATKADQGIGSVAVVLSESLREYVWTAEITIGSDERKIALVSLPRPATGAAFAPALPMVLKATRLFAQEQPILDIAVIDVAGGSRPIVLGDGIVSVYRQQGSNPGGRWELEASFPVAHSRTFPRDLRGRLLLRRDHLFDVYLPGTFCHSSAVAPLSLACNDSDDPWPLTAYDESVRGFFAASRNFFTGVLSPGIGKIANVPAFYSSAEFQRATYTLWAFTAVDGSLHIVDGVTDQVIRSRKWGSEIAAIHSACGSGMQLLASDGNPVSGNSERDGLRAFEIPDRDPVAVSSPLEFDGRGVIVALWPEMSGNSATAIVKRSDTGWYEAYRVSISCGN
jgi:hypothetical protein